MELTSLIVCLDVKVHANKAAPSYLASYLLAGEEGGGDRWRSAEVEDAYLRLVKP